MVELLTTVVLGAGAFWIGSFASRRAAALAWALVLALMLVLGESEAVPLVLLTLAPWWVGRQLRRRREIVSALAEQTVELQAEQAAFVDLAVLRERTRIARDLHDIVAHHLAVIVVQAGAGRMVAARPSERAAARVEIIRRSGREALHELSRLIDVLHADRRDGESGDRMRLLLDEVRERGIEVDVTPLASEIQLEPEVDDVAYRIVQEGLTNVMKHAPGAAVRVRFSADDGMLEIELRNAPSQSASTLTATGSGLGLTGMRERVAIIGGSLSAGTDPDGGWCLRARLPRGDSAFTLSSR